MTGQPTVVVAPRAVYKVVLRPRGIRQLAREVERSQQAATWELFAGHVSELRLAAPFVAVSKRLGADATFERRTALMIDFLTQRMKAICDCPRRPAQQLLDAYFNDLGLTGRSHSELLSRIRSHLDSAALRFTVPVSAMHGDFTPKNALLHGGCLRFLDWEFATPCGSLLFDAWFLRLVITNGAQRSGRALSAGEQVYLESLDHWLPGCGLSAEQFELFGLLTLSLIELSRVESRGKRTSNLAQLVARADRLVDSMTSFA